MFKSIVLICLVSLALTAHAENCSIQSKVLQNYFQTSPFEMDCGYFSSLQQAIDNATKLNGNTPAEKFTLILSPQGSNAGFDHGSIIETPYRFVFVGTYGAEYPLNLYSGVEILNHEYGHYLFKDFFLKEFPQYKSLFQKFNTISQIKIEILSSQDESTKLELQSRLENLMKEVGQSEDFQTYHTITGPYNELFADLLAALVAKDKNAMTKALYYDAMNDFEYRYIRTRSFDAEFKDDDERYMSDEHAFMAYTRNYIGKNIWPKTSNDEQKLIKKVKSAIVQSLKEDFSRGELLDYQEQNQQLINYLSH